MICLNFSLTELSNAVRNIFTRCTPYMVAKTTTMFLFSMLFYQPKMRNATALCGT